MERRHPCLRFTGILAGIINPGSTCEARKFENQNGRDEEDEKHGLPVGQILRMTRTLSAARGPAKSGAVLGTVPEL
jgi:hypothetical protein